MPETFQALIRRLKGLRRARDVSDADFMFALVEARDDEKKWRQRYGSFRDVVQEYDLCPVTRYSGFCKAVTVLARKEIRGLGVDAAILLARLKQSEEWKDSLFDKIVDNVLAHAQTTSSRPTYQWVTQAVQRYRQPRGRNTASIRKLLEENKQLRERNVHLETCLAKTRRSRDEWRAKAARKDMPHEPRV